MIIRDKTAPRAGKVLIVNSDPEISRILEVNLTHANLEVLIAHSGTDALQVIRREKSDIIILDQDLIDSENDEAFRSLNKYSVGIPTIVIGSKQKNKTTLSSDGFAVSYIAKPFDPKEVISLIQRYLMHKERTTNIYPLTGLPKHTHLIEANYEEKGERTNRAVSISKIMHTSLPVADSLQIAMEISRKEARTALKNMQRIAASLVKTVPSELKDTFDQLTNDVQEMAVLCNRSLYLAADFNRRLEMQQDRLVQQQSAQVATSEAILTICGNLMRTIQIRFLLNLESGKRVARFALAMADEMKMSGAERETLYHAALFKDLALAFSRTDDIVRTASIDRELAAALKDRLIFLWKALSVVPFLSLACNLLLYKNERYDGTGGSFGLKGNNILLGSRILAVADAFDELTSPRWPSDKKSLDVAVQEIINESGLSYDPHVVSALLMLLKRNELELAILENKGEINPSISPGENRFPWSGRN